MRRWIPALLLLVCAAEAFGQINISPNTTLAAQTANNTAAWSGYTKDASGNAPAGNVSKTNLQTLLNNRSDVLIGARLIPFWGTSYHPNVGYDQTDYSQAVKQINDAMGRGIDYFSIDWYGPPNSPDQTFNNNAALALKKAAEATNGKFRFALSLDAGALKYCADTSGCSMTQTATKFINYILSNYGGSPAYLRSSDGRPWIYTFDPDRYGTIDWSYVRSHLARTAVLIFRNEQGFKHAQSDGAFAWTCETVNGSMSCLDGFYWNYTHTYYNKIGIGSTYNGFNDNLATWSSPKRYQDQECGLLWLRTWNEANVYPYFSSLSHPIYNIQIASWNDYEEGHEIESGVDNCVDMSAWLSGSTLKWDIGTAVSVYDGSQLPLQNTLAGFTVYVSLDGQNLMPLKSLPAGTRSLDLSQFSFSQQGPYYFLVKANGKPSIHNKMSAAVRYGGSATMTPAVSITSPTQSSSSTSPVHVTAKANFTAARTEVWIDSTNKMYEASGSSIDTYLKLSNGSHRITVASYNSSGSKYTNSVTFNVTTATRSIAITSPTAGATVTSPVTVKGSASGPYAVTAMQIYADGKLAYQVKNSSLVNTQLSLAKGTHYLVLKAWDSTGANWATASTKVNVN